MVLINYVILLFIRVYNVSEKRIPMATTGDRTIPGWKDQVKPDENSHFSGIGCG